MATIQRRGENPDSGYIVEEWIDGSLERINFSTFDEAVEFVNSGCPGLGDYFPCPGYIPSYERK